MSNHIWPDLVVPRISFLVVCYAYSMAIDTNSQTSLPRHETLMLSIFSIHIVGYSCNDSLNKTSCSGLVPASGADCKYDHRLPDALQVKRQHDLTGYTPHRAGMYVVAIMYWLAEL